MTDTTEADIATAVAAERAAIVQKLKSMRGNPECADGLEAAVEAVQERGPVRDWPITKDFVAAAVAAELEACIDTVAAEGDSPEFRAGIEAALIELRKRRR